MATSRHETRFELTASDKTKAAIKSAQDGFSSLDGMVGKLTAGFGLLAGAGGIGALINRQVDGARQAVAYADALQVPIDKLTAMQSAGEVVGIGSDKLADILKDTAEKIADAYRNGGGEAVEVLQGLGLSIQHINSLSPDQQLFAIAEALGQVGTQGEKIQILEALASDASLLLPLLDNNAEKFKTLMNQADETGKTLTRIEADTLLEAGEGMRELDQALDALAQTLAVTLAPYLTNLIEFATEIAGKFKTAETAVEGFFDQLFGAKNDEAFTSLSEAQNRLDSLVSRYDALQGRIENAGNAGTFMANRRLVDLEKEIILQRERVALAEGRQQIMEDYRADRGMAITVTPDANRLSDGDQANMEKAAEKMRASFLGERELLMENHLAQLEMIDQFELNKIETEMGYDDLRLAAAQDLNNKMAALDEKDGQRRMQLESKVQGTINSLKMQGVNIAVGLLRQLGQEHDGAAYAAIALEKAMAVASINIEASKAHMAAYGLLQMGALGPMAVSAMHMQIESSRAFALGMTAASGLVDAYAVGNSSSGISPTTAATPVSPIDNGLQSFPGSTEAGATQGNQLTIRIVGDGKFTELVRDSIEVLSDNDELMIING